MRAHQQHDTMTGPPGSANQSKPVGASVPVPSACTSCVQPSPARFLMRGFTLPVPAGTGRTAPLRRHLTARLCKVEVNRSFLFRSAEGMTVTVTIRYMAVCPLPLKVAGRLRFPHPKLQPYRNSTGI